MVLNNDQSHLRYAAPSHVIAGRGRNPSDDCYIESNHIRNIMILLGSLRNTNGTHGASNSAGTTSYIKFVRRLYLTPFVTLFPEWGFHPVQRREYVPGWG